jgi:uncharacterized membrane protein
MTADMIALATVVGMGVVTFATRAGGLWLMRLIPPTRTVDRFLRHLASSVVVALLAGAAARGDPAAWAAIFVSFAVMAVTGRSFAAIAAGMAAAALWRFAAGGG